MSEVLTLLFFGKCTERYLWKDNQECNNREGKWVTGEWAGREVLTLYPLMSFEF